jgi:hypothetical protein
MGAYNASHEWEHSKLETGCDALMKIVVFLDLLFGIFKLPKGILRFIEAVLTGMSIIFLLCVSNIVKKDR